LDAEATRVVNAMPKWKPGKMGNKNVRVRFTLPINFVLEN
jgi:protein TonB